MTERRQQEGVSLSALPEQPGKLEGYPVNLRGVYDPKHIFLLDNRVLNGRVGFEVLIPFDLTGSNTSVLVNRGFVPMGRTRIETPRIPPVPSDEQRVRGHVYVPEDNPVIDGSGDNLVGEPPWPIIVQVANPVLLQLELDETLYPHLIRLAEDDPNALPRDWPVTTIMPHRHWGYAAQWFLMAAAVVIAWTVFSFRRETYEGKENNGRRD